MLSQCTVRKERIHPQVKFLFFLVVPCTCILQLKFNIACQLSSVFFLTVQIGIMHRLRWGTITLKYFQDRIKSHQGESIVLWTLNSWKAGNGENINGLQQRYYLGLLSSIERKGNYQITSYNALNIMTLSRQLNIMTVSRKFISFSSFWDTGNPMKQGRTRTISMFAVVLNPNLI